MSHKSKLILGGTKFEDELFQSDSRRKFITELNRQNHIVIANKESVDTLQKEIEQNFSDPDLDDEHLVALVNVSGARILCTKDKGLTRYVKTPAFYNNNKPSTKIYNERTHSKLIPDQGFKKKCKLCASI